jgi:hypothetical protein
MIHFIPSPRRFASRSSGYPVTTTGRYWISFRPDLG